MPVVQKEEFQRLTKELKKKFDADRLDSQSRGELGRVAKIHNIVRDRHNKNFKKH